MSLVLDDSNNRVRCDFVLEKMLAATALQQLTLTHSALPDAGMPCHSSAACTHAQLCNPALLLLSNI